MKMKEIHRHLISKAAAAVCMMFAVFATAASCGHQAVAEPARPSGCSGTTQTITIKTVQYVTTDANGETHTRTEEIRTTTTTDCGGNVIDSSEERSVRDNAEQNTRPANHTAGRYLVDSVDLPANAGNSLQNAWEAQQTAPVRPQPSQPLVPSTPGPSLRPGLRANTGASSQHTYYAQLTPAEQRMYDTFYNAVKVGRPSIKQPGYLDDKMISRAVRSIVNDHPELVWLQEGFAQSVTMISSANGDVPKETEVIFKYNDLVNDIDNVQKAFEAAANKILSGAQKYARPVDKEKYIHDYLVSHVKYDNGDYNQSAYGAIVDGKAYCAGFSRAFKYLVNRLNIPSYVVTGMSGGDGDPESHAWNLVVLDGKCYNVDVTSDESCVAGTNDCHPIYKRFNKSDGEFAAMQYVRESEYDPNFVKLPACN